HLVPRFTPETGTGFGFISPRPRWECWSPQKSSSWLAGAPVHIVQSCIMPTTSVAYSTTDIEQHWPWMFKPRRPTRLVRAPIRLEGRNEANSCCTLRVNRVVCDGPDGDARPAHN